MRAGPAAVVIVACAVLASCNWMFTGLGPMNPPCDDKVVRDLPSPDPARKAVESHSACEPGVRVTTIEVTNADGSNRATVMHASFHERTNAPQWPELKVEWKSGTELWVTYPAGVDAQCISSPPGVTVHCLDAAIAR